MEIFGLLCIRTRGIPASRSLELLDDSLVTRGKQPAPSPASPCPPGPGSALTSRPCRPPPGSPRGFVMNWTDCRWTRRCLFIRFWSSPLFLLSLIIHLSTINFFWSKFISYLFRESVCRMNFRSAENIHHGYRFVPLWSLAGGPSGVCACPAEAWPGLGGPARPASPSTPGRPAAAASCGSPRRLSSSKLFFDYLFC